MTNDELNLLHRYLDGVISESELASLEALLRQSEEARTTLRTLATIDAKWQQIAAEKMTVTSQVLADDMQTHSNRRQSAGRVVPIWISFAATAAALLLAAIGWFNVLKQPALTVSPEVRGIARVLRLEGECLTDQGRKVTGGGELFHGEQLMMTRGLIEFAFHETGVHVVTTAPLKTKLDDSSRLFLQQGEMKLVVPPQGVGFVVDTPERKFIDLGTSFVVTASQEGSEVLVLDGEIAVGRKTEDSDEIMREGQFARFDRNGKVKRRSSIAISQSLPEVPVSYQPDKESLSGKLMAFHLPKGHKVRESDDYIANQLLPFIQSGFQTRSLPKRIKQVGPVRFAGIAGAYRDASVRRELKGYTSDAGWMAWYQGQVQPPRPGRYRFWGYADNHLMLAINGRPIFEGSRYDSAFKTLGIPRTDNPSLPCLIARAGFACGQWIELNGDPVRLDLVFGERGGLLTSGLLLVEREGEIYEETYWGQPKWPLFLTESPGADEVSALNGFKDHLEKEVMGSFSIREQAIWKVKR